MPYTSLIADVAHKRLRERWDDSPFWTTLDAYDALRVALAAWQAATGYWTGRVAVPVVPGDPFVPVPGLEQVTAVRWEGQPLFRTTVAELDFMRPGWRADVAGTTGRLPRPWYWAPVGLTTVAIWPTAAGIGALDVDGLAPAPAPTLQSGSTPIDLGEEHGAGLLDLAAWWGAGKAQTSEQDKYQPGLDRFIEAVGTYLGDSAALRPWRAWMERDRELRAPQRATDTPATSTDKATG
jgi:hypothetical protein